MKIGWWYKLRCVSIALIGMTVGTASATLIIGGSDILDEATASQLEAWLGVGSISLTNIFTKTTGDSAVSFHTASDNMGATFSVIEFSDGTIIGGYNPQSWNSSSAINYTPDDADRTAFLFDLTDANQFKQRLTTDKFSSQGNYQTFNAEGNGPTFGAGNDLYISWDLASCTVGTWDPGDGGKNSYAASEDGSFISSGTISKMEVFTTAITIAIPEPAVTAFIGVFGVSFLFIRRIFTA